MKMKKYESGRSMVEILGVIAIISVLSIGGLTGLSYALNKYRTYRIVSGAQHKTMLASTRRKAGQPANRYEAQIAEGIMGYGVSYDSSYTDASLDVSAGKKIVIDKFSKEVCNMLKDDAGLTAIRDLNRAKVLINGQLLENGPECKDGAEANALTIVLDANTRELVNLPEREGKTCRLGGRTYDNNETVGDCGKCVDGEIKVDATKVSSCKTCKTDTWTLENRSNGSHPITEGLEKDKCCVGGVLKYDDEWCPKGCTVGGHTYNDGDDIGTCRQCKNGVVVSKSGYTLPTCMVCNADGTVTDDPTCCKVGSTRYPSGSTIGTCKQCNEGSVVAKSGYTLPSCKVCNADGSVTTDTTCCTVGSTTYANGAVIGTCKQCSNGTVVAKSGYTVPSCKVCNADGSVTTDTTCCTVGSTTYANGATIGTCKQCSNGTVVAKSGYTVPSCKVCNADGSVTTDTTCCTVGSTTYANGATIGTCKQCSNGTVVAKSGYTLPSCKVCNADGSVTADSTCCTVGSNTYANGASVGACGTCRNGSVTVNTGKCVSNSDCPSNQFCKYEASSLCGEPTCGTCTNMGNTNTKTITSSGLSGTTIYYSATQMNWYSAKNWCERKGKTLFDSTRINCNCSKKDCCTTAEIKQLPGSKYFWAANGIEISTKYHCIGEYCTTKDNHTYNGNNPMYALCQ